MRLLTIALFALALPGCATNVYDSLDRRGVDAKTVLVGRAGEFRSDAVAARSAMAKAQSALEAIEGSDGAALARLIDGVRSEGQNAALAAQDLRLSADSLKAASARYFGAREEELALLTTDDAQRAAAQDNLEASKEAYRRLLSALDASSLRLSPALSLIDAEATALRQNPTSGITANARRHERAAARAAATDAQDGIAATIDAADNFVRVLK